MHPLIFDIDPHLRPLPNSTSHENNNSLNHILGTNEAVAISNVVHVIQASKNQKHMWIRSISTGFILHLLARPNSYHNSPLCLTFFRLRSQRSCGYLQSDSFDQAPPSQ